MTAAEPTPPVDLDAIRARCDAATAGPWEYAEDNGIVVAGLQRHGPGHISYDTLIVAVEGGEPGLDETEQQYDARVEANAAFVAAAWADVPALLALVEQQAAEIERLRRERADFRAACKSVGDRATKAKAQRDVLLAETVRQDRRIADLDAHILRLCSCMDPPAIDRRCFVHGDPPASTWRLARDRTRAAEHEAERLEAELTAARAEIADHEREAETTGRIIADLEAINGDVSGENGRLGALVDTWRIAATCRGIDAAAAVAERDEARAEVKATRAENARLASAVELWLDNGAVREARAEALRALIAGYGSPVCRYHDAPDETCTCPDEVLAARRAPEGPAGTTAPRETPDA